MSKLTISPNWTDTERQALVNAISAKMEALDRSSFNWPIEIGRLSGLKSIAANKSKEELEANRVHFAEFIK